MANLKEFMARWKIKRINFDEVKPTGLEEQYGSDKLVCPYCEKEIEYEGEETEEIIKGKTEHCWNCGKWFYAQGEVSIDTTCTPIEDYLLQRWVRRNIEETYAHDDECDKKGLEWSLDYPFGYVEYETYKEYAEPLFENMAADQEEDNE